LGGDGLDGTIKPRSKPARGCGAVDFGCRTHRNPTGSNALDLREERKEFYTRLNSVEQRVSKLEVTTAHLTVEFLSHPAFWIVVAAASELIALSPLKSNSIVQLVFQILTLLKAKKL
jgi:hypothetical protein